jgi:hypothetical protein
MRVPDVARQHPQVPRRVFGQREEQVGLRAAGTQRRDAAVGGLEELPRVAEGVPQRLVRLADILQVSGQAVDELERGELPLHGHHGAQEWCAGRFAVK